MPMKSPITSSYSAASGRVVGSKLAALLCAAVAVLLVSLADAATYDFTNTAGGSFEDTANWKGGSVPPVSDTSASLMFTNVTSGSTVTLGDGHYAWEDMQFGSGKYGVYADGYGATTDDTSDWYFGGGSFPLRTRYTSPAEHSISPRSYTVRRRTTRTGRSSTLSRTRRTTWRSARGTGA